MSVSVSIGREPIRDPHKVELTHEQYESPDSNSLEMGKIAIVVGRPLIDNEVDSRDKR